MGLIGSAVGALGSIAGGVLASQAADRLKGNIQAQQRKNQDWYDYRYNEDATQRADAQRILTMTEESIKNRNRQAANAQAVMGGTDESTAAAKAANAQALADATAQIAVNGEQRKDQIEQQYMARDAELNNKMQQVQKERTEAIAGAVQGVAEVAKNMPF